MAVFIEKPPVTSSNFYETMKNASILMKLGTNVDHSLCNSMLNCKFPVTMATGGGMSQNCEKSLFCIVFFHQN
jgi:hypothetical protein